MCNKYAEQYYEAKSRDQGTRNFIYESHSLFKEDDKSGPRLFFDIGEVNSNSSSTVVLLT